MGEIARDAEEHQRIRTGGGHRKPPFLASAFSSWPPNPITKGGQHLVGEVVLAARAEAFVQRGTENRGRDRLVDGRRDRPASLARVRHPAGELRQVRAIEERDGGQVQQPRGDDAAATPDLGDVGQVQIVLVVLGVAQRRGFGIDGALLLAGVGVAKDVQPLRVGGHDAVLDAVVDHLDEVARAARTAVQVAVFGGAAYLLPTGRARRRLDTWRQGGEDRGRGAGRRLPRRRSSGSSRAPTPRPRRWSRRPHSECPSVSARRRGGCRRGSRSCRRR